jgi:AraC-like DNA-binding protein
MRNYVRTGVETPPPRLLEVVHDGRVYTLAVKHAGTERWRQVVTGGKQVTYYVPREGERTRVFTGTPTAHAHIIYHLVLYTQGESTFLLNGAQVPATRGTLALVDPGMLHCFPPASPGELTYAQVCFALQHDEQVLDWPFRQLLGYYAGCSLPECGVPLHLDERQTETIAGLLSTLTGDLTRRHPFAEFQGAVTLAHLLSFITHECYQVQARDTETTEALLRECKAEIARRYHEEVSIAELAAMAGLSKGYFQRAFKEQFGVTPIALQRQLRVEAAKNLLLTSDLLIAEIARRVGFADQYFFSKTFSKLAGITPSAYRRRGQAG